MQFMTTFCPRKVMWELSYVHSQGTHATSTWGQHYADINESLIKLRKAGIQGIRMVVFPFEIIHADMRYDWQPIEILLNSCYELDLDVDVCLGPFQYPYYPGIRLPEQIMHQVSEAPY